MNKLTNQRHPKHDLGRGNNFYHDNDNCNDLIYIVYLLAIYQELLRVFEI